MTDPELVLGPMLRYVDATSATIWVETSGPADVEVLGRHARTFRVGSHHYALVVLTGLDRQTDTTYDVRLDSRQVWPPAGSPYPPSRLRTLPDGPRHVAVGSCRVDRPHHPPFNEPVESDPDAVGEDALRTLAMRMREQEPDEWPDLLLFVGDQVYADEGLSPRIAERIEARQDREHPDSPRGEVGDFEEFTWLYQDSWGDPGIRWLLSTVGSAMIFDDHDVRDDWNISGPWLDEVRHDSWWPARIHGAMMSYWLYQHLGNLSPSDIEHEGLLAKLCAADDGLPVLREAMGPSDVHRDRGKPVRWSYRRDVGPVRLLVVDSRSERVLDDGHRAMLGEREFAWVEEQLTDSPEHLVVVTSLPLLLTPSMHHAECFWDALADGAWGARVARLAERVRQAEDVDHWAAFRASFDRMVRALVDVACGRRGEPPLDVVVVSGDVHYSYVADVVAPAMRCPVVQLTASPIRNDLKGGKRREVLAAGNGMVTAVTKALARAVGVRPEPVRWRMTAGPAFGNAIARVELRNDGSLITVEHTDDGSPHPQLHETLRYRTCATSAGER